MNALVVGIFYPQIQQSFSMFVESMKNLDPAPKKIILYDLFEQRKLDSKPVESLIEVRSIKKEDKFLEQISNIRNKSIDEAKKGDYDALFFTLANIFPPVDVLQRFFDSFLIQKRMLLLQPFTIEKKILFFQTL